MCGDCFGKPCKKVGVAAKGDTFSVEPGVITLNGQNFYEGDVSLDAHIPGVFIQFTAHHNIDKHIVEWAANVNGERKQGIHSYVRKSLNNFNIPAVTITNRCMRLASFHKNAPIKQAMITTQYHTMSNFGLTDHGWRTFMRQAKMAA